MEGINQHAEKGIPKIIVANKIDKEDDREVSEKQGRDNAEQYNMNYFETSAKENRGITECMNDIFEQVINRKFYSKATDASAPRKSVMLSKGGHQSRLPT